jgi:hypothetical protein
MSIATDGCWVVESHLQARPPLARTLGYLKRHQLPRLQPALS